MNKRTGRRLLEGFQQRIERFRGQHVRFVDDENLVAVARRKIAHVFAQFADFVDSAVGGRVDFQTSMELPAAISWQEGHSPQGVAVGP